MVAPSTPPRPGGELNEDVLPPRQHPARAPRPPPGRLTRPGAACTVFPEMCVFLTPYLVRDYAHAYAMFNGEIGRQLDETFQKKYKLKALFFYDYGFRHFWNSRKPIATPAD